MSENELLTTQIKKYINTDKYSIEQFMTFLENKSKLITFFRDKNQEFINLKTKYPNLLLKYSNDIGYGKSEAERRLKYNYNAEEKSIIQSLNNSVSLLFYALNVAFKTKTQEELTDNSIESHLFYYYVFGEKDDRLREKIIEYIIDNCILADNTVESGFSSLYTKEFKNLISTFTDRQSELAEAIYKSDRCNLSRKELAAELNISEKGIQSLINELKSQKNIEGLKDLRQKIKNTKN